MTNTSVKWVRQEDPNGCAIAVAAMIVGVSYQEAKAHFVEKQPDAGIQPISTYELHEYLKSQGWERCGHLWGTLWKDDDGGPITFIEGAELTYCSVVPFEGAPFHHGVLMLPDGSILDPVNPQPVASIYAYPQTSSADGWRRK